MFSAKLNDLLHLLEVRSADLARQARCDPSHISRMVTGKRIPEYGRTGAWRVVNALYLAADERGKVPELVALIHCPDGENPESVKQSLMNWLYEGERPQVQKKERSREKIPFRVFGEKLNAVMELTNITNIRLGRSLNLDPSYISRFRNGLRSPRGNPALQTALCTVLLERIYTQDKLAALAQLTALPSERFTNREKTYETLFEWLYTADGVDGTPLVENLIDQIGSFHAEDRAPACSPQEVAGEEALNDTAETYFGIAGLRRAVLRFLGQVVLRREEELLLYSDQSLDWMVSDSDFGRRWGILMLLCMAGGTRVSIIHHVNRDIGEMTNAVRSWLPLYSSGMIRSYYCRPPLRPRFSTTLFLCPGFACIAGSNVVGTEAETGLYRYDTAPALLAAHEAAYRGLLNQSDKLIHVSRDSDSEEPVPGKALAAVSPTLSLATLPEETLCAALQRIGAEEAVREKCLALRRERVAALERVLQEGSMHEYVPLPSDEALFDGQVNYDLPGLTLAYTPQEYAAHIRSIAALTEQHTGYRFYPLPDTPFQDVKVVVSDNCSWVTRTKEPYLTFRFNHPSLCQAFLAYIGQIREQYRQDKLSIKRLLERFE